MITRPRPTSSARNQENLKMRKHMIFAAAAATALTTAVSAPAFGQLVAYDPFLSGNNRGAGEYSPGNNLAGQGAAALGWVGTSGIDGFGVPYTTPAGSAVTGNFQANALGEDSAAVDYEQGGRVQWIGVGNFPADRTINRQLNPIPASPTYFMSIMTNRLAWSGTPADNTYVVGGFTDATGTGLLVGYDDVLNDGTPELVFRSTNDPSGTSTILLPDAPSSDNQLVIVGLTINTAGNDVLEIFVDPPSLTATSAPTLTVSSINVTDSLTPFTEARFSSPGQSGVVFFDELRLATDFISVTAIPEPATIGLLGLGGLGLMRRRKA
ncbi:MAG: PEP-CTERM sorting domain-containing protein [Planctomycetota bacterium]